MDEVTITLAKPVEVMVNGEIIESTSVYMKAPTGLVRRETAIIHGAFGEVSVAMQRIWGGDSGRRPASSVALQPPPVINRLNGLLCVAGVQQIVHAALEDMYKKGFVTIEGQPLTEAVLSRMPYYDIELIHETFLENFMMPLWIVLGGIT